METVNNSFIWLKIPGIFMFATLPWEIPDITTYVGLQLVRLTLSNRNVQNINALKTKLK